jgi:hypothetical protein
MKTPEGKGRTPMTENQRKALALLGQASRRFDCLDLTGPRNAKLRQTIMALLVGSKLPQAKCGVNALRDEFYKIAKPEGHAIASREQAFTAWAQQEAE